MISPFKSCRSLVSSADAVRLLLPREAKLQGIPPAGAEEEKYNRVLFSLPVCRIGPKQTGERILSLRLRKDPVEHLPNKHLIVNGDDFGYTPGINRASPRSTWAAT